MVYVRIDYVVYPATGLRRFLHQPHADFFQCMTGLAMVALFAGAGYVVPGMFTTTVTGYHVIKGEFVHLLTAVLAGVFVADKHFMSGELAPVPRAMYLVM